MFTFRRAESTTACALDPRASNGSGYGWGLQLRFTVGGDGLEAGVSYRPVEILSPLVIPFSPLEHVPGSQ